MAYNYFLAKEEHLPEIFDILSMSFPKCERRDDEVFEKIFKEKKNFHILCLGDNAKTQTISAFIMVWDLEDFVFIENFAVKGNLRGKGLGGALLDIVLSRYKKAAILEVEPPVDHMTKRRISFYEMHNFVMNEHLYEMPPFRTTEKPLPLKIMSYPQALPEEYFNMAKKIIYKEVYDKII